MSLLLNKLQLIAPLFRPNLTTKVIPMKFIHSSSEEKPKATTALGFLRDRTTVIPVETSILYLKSKAYEETYGKDPVWKFYRRNYKGQIAPKKTRKTCIRGGMLATGNPCPICRDEYLILDYRNINLLKQFISDHSGEILDSSYTNICQRAYKELCIAVMKAKEYGLLTYHVPFRYYNYSEWYNNSK